MNESDAGSLVISILARHTGLEPDEIDPTMRVRDDLGLDSLDAVELLMVIEQQTGRRFQLDDTDDIGTVAEIIAKLAEAAAAPPSASAPAGQPETALG